jgi:hypothetical protein
MSYSFSVRAATRAAVLALVAAELDKVKEAQPMHSHDRDQALAAATAFVEIMPDGKAGYEIGVSMHGSVGWSGDSAGDYEISGAGVGVSAHFVQAS